MVDNYMSSITDVAAAVLPTAQTAAISNSNKRALVDGRVGSIGQFTATGVNPGIIFDTGSVLSVAANRLIFPAGHSGFSGKDLAIYHDSVISMASPNLACLCAVSGSGVMDAVLTAGSERYWQFIVYSAVVSDVFSLSGCWLGAYSQLSAAAAVAPDFVLGWQSQQVETDYPGGVAVIEVAAPRRTFSLTVRDVDPASADYTLLDSVMQSREKSFWYWPPDDATPGPFLVRLSKDAQRSQEFGAPSQALRYKFSFEFLEDNL